MPTLPGKADRGAMPICRKAEKDLCNPNYKPVLAAALPLYRRKDKKKKIFNPHTESS